MFELILNPFKRLEICTKSDVSNETQHLAPPQQESNTRKKVQFSVKKKEKNCKNKFVCCTII